MTAENEKKTIGEIEKRYSKTAEQIRDDREKRVRDAMALRVPDQVPVSVNMGVFAAKYAGLTASVMYYDPAAYRAACKKMLLDFEPDNGPMGVGSSGKVLEILGSKQYRWPGGTLPADGTYQFVEGEYMKPDEYPHFLDNPADFIIRRYLPRTYRACEILEKAAPFAAPSSKKELADIVGMLFMPNFRTLKNILEKRSDPGIKDLLAKLDEVLKIQEDLGKQAADFGLEMERYGFPSGMGGGGYAGSTFAPFDTISDRLRGMRGAMLDMYRLPETMLNACDQVLGWEMNAATPAQPDSRGNPVRTGMPLHRGSDGFMSKKDFEKFYWPTLKKAIEIKVGLGYTVTPFFEGIWDDRLEYLLDLPKGKVVFYCEKTDIFKAKEVLGGHLCIQGGVPPTILQAGSPQDVEELCKKLCRVVGKGGGFILSAGSVIDHARPENIKAMVEAAKKYGKYR
jgi:hypothetical protein